MRILKWFFHSEYEASRRKFGARLLSVSLWAHLILLGLGLFMVVFAIDSAEVERSGHSLLNFDLKVNLLISFGAFLYARNRALIVAFIALFSAVAIFSMWTYIVFNTDDWDEVGRVNGICHYHCETRSQSNKGFSAGDAELGYLHPWAHSCEDCTFEKICRDKNAVEALSTMSCEPVCLKKEKHIYLDETRTVPC